MTPLSFEWLWNIEYFIFMGFLYLALAIIVCGLVVAYIKTWVHIHQEDKSEVSPPKIASRSKYSEY
jgi:NhaP-type Na+/H+ or K+/H+ antiporter